jgi:hypothetical protein
MISFWKYQRLSAVQDKLAGIDAEIISVPQWPTLALAFSHVGIVRH